MQLGPQDTLANRENPPGNNIVHAEHNAGIIDSNKMFGKSYIAFHLLCHTKKY